MSPQAQRIEIAKACGWTPAAGHGPNFFIHPSGAPIRHWQDLPDYLNDLNAMHEAEKALGAGDWKYVEELKRGSGLDYSDDVPYSLTAVQRAKAFLRAIGKWDDSK